MTDMLSQRKQKILNSIISDYISDAEPVGSKHLSGKYRLGISPATIRNEMAELEEEGYIKQPHTSAGRVPSDKGYRYYVDNLMRARPLTHKEEGSLKSALNASSGEPDRVLHQTMMVVSSITHYAAVATLGKASKRVYHSGISNIAEQPEFRDILQLKNILKLFDEEVLLSDIIEESSEGNAVNITIGSENRHKEIRECSLVVSSFGNGSIAIIGPTRMFYNRAMSIIDFVREQLSVTGSI